MKRRVFGLLAAFAVGVPAASGQSLPVSTSPAVNAPDLGRVMTGPSSSTFSISATGAVTRLSGSAIRLTGGGATVPTVTITCNVAQGGLCNNGEIRVTVTAASNSRAAISRFEISDLTCGGAGCTLVSGPTPGPSVTFTVKAPGKDKTVTFKIPMQVTLAANSATGTAPYTYIVTADLK